MRYLLIVGLVGIGLGCGSRATLTPDGQPLVDSGARRDHLAQEGPSPPRRDAPAACSTLGKLGQVGLELADTMKLGARIAHDGERFVVVWHSQPGVVSSMNGELRFALVDAGAKTTTPDGIKLGPDNGIMASSLVPGAHEHAILHLPVAGGGLELRRIDPGGQTLHTATISGTFYQGAMAQHPSGHAVLVARQYGNPELLVVDSSGSVSGPKILGSAQVMASLWLAPRTGGFAAAWSSTNKNASLFMLDPSLQLQKTTNVGHGALVTSPSFAVTTGGFASVYVAYGNQVESEVYDASGERLGHQTLRPAGTAITTAGATALAWSGKQLLAVYPGAVEGQYVAQVLDASGVPAGSAVPLPSCLAVARGVSATWGAGQPAVASINEASGVMSSNVCVTMLGCK